MRGYVTNEMLLLDSLYDDNNLMAVRIKGEKVNVRDEPKNGDISFQVRRSQNDRLVRSVK